ncbi:MAG: hypothetical protein Q9225_007599, partial [Loekoesia sp. 1 TL-2023]
MFLGAIQAIINVRDALGHVYPDEVQWLIDHWSQPDQPTASLAYWPTDASRDIKPVACHSHNDYWRRVPLYSAIQAGCISVEADVWLFDQELYVGHTEPSLTAERTLRNLYIEPLLDLMDRQNQETRFHQKGKALRGVFDTHPSQTLVLLIDFKNSSAELYAELLKQLLPLRQKGYLTHFNGTDIVKHPITVVGSGNAPFDLIAANKTYRDVFFDAPLDKLADLSHAWPNPNRISDHQKPANRALFNRRIAGRQQPTNKAGDSTVNRTNSAAPTTISDPNVFTWQNSYFGSTSFTSAIGNIEGSRLSQPQLQLLRAQIHGAHQKGLK